MSPLLQWRSATKNFGVAGVEIIGLTFNYSSCQSRCAAKKFGGARVTTLTDSLLWPHDLTKTEDFAGLLKLLEHYCCK